MVLLEAGEFLGSRSGVQLLQLLGEIGRLLVALDVLEAQGHLYTTKEAFDLLTRLGQEGSRADEALLAAELAQRSTADTLDDILEGRVGDALDNGLDVLGLLLLADVRVLGRDEVSGLLEGVLDDFVQLLVGQDLMNVLEAAVVAVVGGRGVAGVDGEELALDVGLEVVDEVNALDRRRVAVERLLLDAPLVELLDEDVHASALRLQRHNAVNSRISEAGLRGDVGLGLLGQVLLDEATKSVGGANGVLASNDGKRVGLLASLDALGDRLGDELEDVGTDGASDGVGGGDLMDDLLHAVLGVEGAVVVDGELLLAILANLGDFVARSLLERLDKVVHDIHEHDLEPGVVEELGDEAAANVAATEVNALLACHCGWVEVAG